MEVLKEVLKSVAAYFRSRARYFVLKTELLNPRNHRENECMSSDDLPINYNLQVSSPISEQQPHTQREPRRLKVAGANGEAGSPSKGRGMKPDNWDEDDSR